MKLTRVCVLLAALFVTVDAGLCPVLCLYAERGEHGSSTLPSQTASSTACGACVCALAAIDNAFLRPPTPVVQQPAELSASPPVLTPASEIDHPPRRS